jgi:hypothetical protein
LPLGGDDFEEKNLGGEGVSHKKNQEEWCHKEGVCNCFMDISHLHGLSFLVIVFSWFFLSV